MLLGKNNFNYLVINYEKFNISGTYFDYDRNKDFININYKSLVDLEGIHLKTPLIRMINSIKLIDENHINKKYVLEVPIDDNLIFSKIFSNFDSRVADYLKLNPKFENNRYIKNIKYSYYKNKYKYKTVKLKINSNNCLFYYNNKKYEGDILDLNLEKMSVKCYISSHGLWKFEQNYGMTWRCLKLYFYDIQDNQEDNQDNQDNIDYYLKRELLYKIENDYSQLFNNFNNNFNKNDSDEEIQGKSPIESNDSSESNDEIDNKCESSDSTRKNLSHCIPNFELDIDF
jgi:hypothetical protein